MSSSEQQLPGAANFVHQELCAEIAVVGAGVAGLCAALAAARGGARVILVTDRPVLGGSASVEVGVAMNGSAYSPFNLWSRESGIAEEIRNRHAACWSGEVDSYWTAMDRVYLDMALAEPGLRLLFNTTIVGARTAADRSIEAVHGVQLRAERVYTISASFFIDCSGDGTLGGMAGADARQGREARHEFEEGLAPETADERTMGTTLLWRSRDVGRPVAFRAPAWAVDVSQLPAFARPGSDPTREIGRSGLGAFHGLWWAEYGGQIDTLHDDQQVLLHTRALVYGIWDWIKNSGRVDNVANQELTHVAVLGGKRESRRLLGPVILTENHWRGQTRFDDAVCYSGWPIDVHPPRGYLDAEPGCTHVWLPGPGDIPLRSLYSRNLPNLFFAGRCFSATHVGLGSPRVIATTAVCGQAAGTAAVLCLRQDTSPGKLTPMQVDSLQQTLLRMDQSIIGRRLDEPDDLARKATITASSTRCLQQLAGGHFLALDPESLPGLADAIDHTHSRWYSGSAGALVVIPAAAAVECVELQFLGRAGQAVDCRLYLAERPENYRCQSLAGACSAILDAQGWARFDTRKIDPGAGLKLLLHFPPQAGLALRVSSGLMPGVAVMRVWDRPDEPLREHELSRVVCTPCFRVTPEPDLFAAANVADGHIRPHGLPHQWCSDALPPYQPAVLTLEWQAPVAIGQVELVFDTQLNGERPGIAESLVKDYELSADVDGLPVKLASVTGNTLRFVVHRCAAIRARRLDLRIGATHGAPRAAVYAVRVYGPRHILS